MIGLVFPHQLFEQSVLLDTCSTIYVIEEHLFFKQYAFHKQKLAFHRASMQFYKSYLQSLNKEVVYVESIDAASDIRHFFRDKIAEQSDTFHYIDPTDTWLKQRLIKAANKHNISLVEHVSPLFLNTSKDNADFFAGKKRMFQTDYYQFQRKKRNILLDTIGKPLGGKWSYDDENRLKYPKGKQAPITAFLPANNYYTEATNYVERHFAANPGQLAANSFYPCTFEESKQWLNTFLQQRFAEFGPYEDALLLQELVLHHSVLSPLINIGLLPVGYVVSKSIEYAQMHDVPINSLEGFVRQLMGWREFIRAVYEQVGKQERTKNYWGFKRKIPASFYTGTTGIEPIDNSIKKVLKHAYVHHIERLMVLGNFMLLCEFDPDEVYKWFMELFIDAYDWVMVPNVYGMSQFADGGLMATKPYISGSNYLLKMGDYKKGDWQQIWDALFWHFMDKQRDFFLQNPRLGMLVRTFDKMAPEKREKHLELAREYLGKLDSH
ncbi:MAG: cryptochrome/photolyase family protein [Bacteroidia bacterium]|nr:cryptochrome/photolyase family protein [Bacteroidia bacterium]